MGATLPIPKVRSATPSAYCTRSDSPPCDNEGSCSAATRPSPLAERSPGFGHGGVATYAEDESITHWQTPNMAPR